jgi:hypothetical protein
VSKPTQPLSPSKPTPEAPASFRENWPAGHFYSVLPSPADVARAAVTDDAPGPLQLPGIDMHDADQLALLDAFAALAPAFPYLSADRRRQLRPRYRPDNNMFGLADGLAYFCFLRHFAPRRIVEIGSGFSSALALDVNEFWLDRAMRLTFIEPYCERLKALLRASDQDVCRVIEQPVQTAPREVFASLEAGDLLFIDSSHVGKAASDLLHILFEVLPALPSGCLIHFHDIFWPFDYPRHWYDRGRAWNEAYFVRTLLSSGGRYRVLFHGHYLSRAHEERRLAAFPGTTGRAGGSLYLVKTASPG